MQTEKIRKLTKEFDDTSNLFRLAEAYILLTELLKKEEFPIAKYIKWLKQESLASFSTT